MKGLHLHINARTPKLAKLPMTRPPTRQKLITVAATSTSSLLSFNLLLCSRLGALIIHMLPTYPLLNPKSNSMRKNRTSLLMKGVVPGLMLHRRKSGMKSVRARENPKRRFSFQVRRAGKVQRERPAKSPRLKMRKWTEEKMSALVSGCTGCTEIVMGGYTDCCSVKSVSIRSR